ncbi:MAG: HAD family hydrolase [Myxococcales bacterium]|nr:HAD family hydrolase [Myxococcales bacterium]
MNNGFPSAIVFDMDGVLVDTTTSYHQATLETVRLVLAELTGVTPEATSPVDPAWIHALKSASGFNNDWDCSAALVRVLLRPDWSALGPEAVSRRLADAGGGLTAVESLLGPEPRVNERGAVKDHFQLLYLGSSLYEAIEGRSPPRRGISGLIDTERPMADLETLAALPVRRAIATGRPRLEAWHALDVFGLRSAFDAVVTHDDGVEAQQPGKPHPWCLLEAARRLALPPGATCWYVGDTPDDMRAARAAGFVGIGLPASEAAGRALVAAGASRLIERVSDLLPLR